MSYYVMTIVASLCTAVDRTAYKWMQVFKFSVVLKQL